MADDDPPPFEPVPPTDPGWVPGVLDALREPEVTAARLRELPVSADAAKLLALLDPAALSGAGLVDVLYLLRRQAAVLAAARMRVLAAIDADSRRDERAVRFGCVQTEIAPVLQTSDGAARLRVEQAVFLTQRLPDTVAALGRGEITVRHAEFLHDRLADRSSEVTAAVEADLLGRAGISLRAWQRRTNLLLVRLDPRTEDERRAVAVEQRQVRSWHAGVGMDTTVIEWPCESAAALTAFTDAAVSRARRDPEDARTVGQIRVDSLTALLTKAVADDLAGGVQPTAQGSLIRPTVIVGLDTLLGLDDLPARLEGHDDITAAHARQLVADTIAGWSLQVVDRRGRLVDRVEKAHEPSDRLKAFIAARDRHCQFPGCSRRAVFCDQDHVIDWPTGATCADNLHSLCRGHHNAKTSGRWTVMQLPDDGSSVETVRVWTSPTGHTYTTRGDQNARHDPPTVPPASTPPDDKNRDDRGGDVLATRTGVPVGDCVDHDGGGNVLDASTGEPADDRTKYDERGGVLDASTSRFGCVGFGADGDGDVADPSAP